ncbi:hypothetical protein BCB70_02800 [Cutibacterium modestum]|uniref:Uncharacterized protein n=1 Tax=Cutibacterium modestum HL044PA1 TaxID=765109 RepID=A0ABP2K3B0_9ACTN|nr:hypothetical protein BCB70_02800 [Cutibacterium modestum]EFS91266.1 hypothetical protein HMPREF9607_02557 [Cutibacterium modestum HL044PA1]
MVRLVLVKGRFDAGCQERRGVVKLVEAPEMGTKMRKSLDDKRIHGNNDQPIFDKVIVIADRQVLDTQP